MRWVFLIIAVCAFASLWNEGPAVALFSAFLVMCANFATFCLLYERPNDRARLRVAQRLRQLNPNTDTAQRLATAQIATTVADRRLGFGPMPLANLLTGIAAICLLVWGVALHVF